jgi:ribosomal protein S14
VERPPWMTDFSLFAAHLKEIFGDPDVVGNVSNKLLALKQTGSATSYAAEFRRLAGQLEWGNQALVGQFFRGLKNSVQDELVRTDYSREINALISQAIRVDNLQQSRLAQSAQVKSATPAASPGQRLTEQQKEFRRKNNRCMYCGDPGHFLRSCPARSKNLARPGRVSEATWVEAESPGNEPTQST